MFRLFHSYWSKIKFHHNNQIMSITEINYENQVIITTIIRSNNLNQNNWNKMNNINESSYGL